MMDETRLPEAAESTPETPPSSSDVGMALRVAREKASLDIADAARRLKLGVRQIEALEAGDFSRFSSPTFVRGFIRNYARFLGVDAQPLLDAYRQTDPKFRQQVIVPVGRQVSFSEHTKALPRKYMVAFAVILVAVGATALYDRLPLRDLASMLHLDKNAVASSATAAPAAEPSRLPEPAQAVPQPLPAAVVPAAAPVAPSAEAAPMPVPVAVEAAAGGVELSFNGDSWVEVRERGGRVVYSQLNHANSRQTIQATPPLELTIGNAPAVRLNYRGQAMDLAGVTNSANVAHLRLD
jgi:cytoskeleton protein RodZ